MDGSRLLVHIAYFHIDHSTVLLLVIFGVCVETEVFLLIGFDVRNAFIGVGYLKSDNYYFVQERGELHADAICDVIEET